MASFSKIVKPANQRLLRMSVRGSRRLSDHWMRVTLGGGDIAAFSPMGYDQWFRLFLPLSEGASLEKIPPKANRLLGYLRFMTVREGVRPTMRNYTVRSYRAESDGGGTEIDVDFVLHAMPDGSLGPAAQWASETQPGEEIALIDEGIMFNPERGTRRVLLVGDETALPAISGIAEHLPDDATGLAIIEVPSNDDALEFAHPDGLQIQWVVRPRHDDRPGDAALAALAAAPVPDNLEHAFVAGEQRLSAEGRRLLVGEHGIAKESISFCGYWRMAAQK